ncbi:hypothetical protein FALBO_4099 [Fusarium albosuccineum]|uniref:Uncharacterized protein n=1 Tax=Fusarium albosuccineum TaxID=1237068 RepID=A0A8H4LJ02_9HYPO|nr:hypothetical protein FALBO_4099 [Fusarium albosuccineum]
MPVLPSSTTRSIPHLAARQNDPSSTTFVAVPSTYGALDDSPHPGVVAGIVLGSVAGFLLLLYLVYALLHRGPVVIPVDTSTTTGGPMSSVTGDSSTHVSRSVISFRSRKDKRPRKPRSNTSKRTRSRATTVRSRERSRRRVSPVIVDPPPGNRVVVEPPAPPRVVPGSAVSALSSDNEIIVEEENSPSPPRRSYTQRYSQERYRRETAYRDDGPDGYGVRGDYSPRRDSRRYSRGG